MNTARAAPLLKASIPMAPEPAKRSRIEAPSMSNPIVSKIDPLTSCCVGLKKGPWPQRKSMPFFEPAMTLMGTSRALYPVNGL